MLSVARRWALCRTAALIALLTAVPLASASAASAGVDTPSFSQPLPLAVGGTPIITLSTNPDGSNPVATVIGNLEIPSSLNNGIHVTNGTNSLTIFDDGNGHIEGTTGAWMWINGNSNAITSISAGGGTTIINQNGGNVGVNTSSPGTTLEVNGATTIDRNWLYLAGAGDTNHAIGNLLNVNGNDAEQFRYWAFLDFLSAQTGTSAMRILNNGNVGIGVTSPIVSLDVSSVAHFGGSTSPVFTSQGAYISWNGLTGGTGETDFINNPGLGAGGFDFVLSNSAGNSVTSAMFIDGSGNVGITGTLQVKSNTCAAGTPLVSDGNGGVVCGASSAGVTTYKDSLGSTQPHDLGMHLFCALGGLGTPTGNDTDGSHQLVYASGNVGNLYHWYAYLDQSASHWIGEIYVTCLD